MMDLVFLVALIYGGVLYAAWRLPKPRWGKWLGVGVVVSPALWAALWWWNLDGSYSFKEEVKLGSGEQIVVKRRVVSEVFFELGGSGGWDAKYNSLEIASPKRADNPMRKQGNGFCWPRFTAAMPGTRWADPSCRMPSFNW